MHHQALSDPPWDHARPLPASTFSDCIFADHLSTPATDGMVEGLEFELIKNLFYHESELFTDSRMDPVQRVSPIVRVRTWTGVDRVGGEVVEIIVFTFVADSEEKANIEVEADVCIDAITEAVVKDLLTDFSWDGEEVWRKFCLRSLSHWSS